MERLKFALLALLAVAGTAGTATASERQPLAVAAITTQQAQIRDEVIAGKGRYKDMPANTRTELLSKQAAMLALLEGKTSSAELSDSDRIEVFNTLEWIEAAINRAEDERMVCKREKRLGSNRMEVVCKTAAQIEEEREAARRNFGRGCGSGACFEQ